ncbi:MAG TPA: adenylate/guanylate cyclase domain-containing protein [Actinomycetota bacterium]|nr:adenylate/guanylate cyclase domain-containing protein [Actinomycetota bacterium]
MEAETRYARSGELHIAYQVFGRGPIDVVICPGFVSNVEAAWDIPALRTLYEALSTFARVIAFDQRDTGLSDPAPAVPTLEERMDDVRAVMDAAGVERVALFGVSEGGPMTILFAATYPERVTHLVLYGSSPAFVRSDRFPHGQSLERLKQFLDAERWGTGFTLEWFTPSLANDPDARAQWARWERTGASPAMAAKLLKSNVFQADVIDVLPTINAPTLVLHCNGDIAVPVAGGRYLAEHIPGAKYVEIEGGDHLPWGDDARRILQETQEFLTGTSPAAEPDRILATIVLTDICGSTEQAARVGDRAWSELLDRYEDMVRRQVARFNGTSIKFTGDGTLATFDGPARAVRCASALVEQARKLELRVRAGVHTGECEVRGNDIGGIAVHIASRIADLALPEEVLVSSTVKDLVTGSGLQFNDRGMHALKGVPDEWRLLLFSGTS